YAEGDLEDFARRQGATPHPAERAALDGFGELEVLYSRPLSPRTRTAFTRLPSMRSGVAKR
ncbi:hypothetical protein CJU33_33145, partial [Pseudomonas aeruginosa]